MLYEVVGRTVFGKLKGIKEEDRVAMLTPLTEKGTKWRYPKWYVLFIKGDQSVKKTLDRVAGKYLMFLSDNNIHHIHRGSGIGRGTITACYELGWVRWDFGHDSCVDGCYGAFSITEAGQTILKKNSLVCSQ
ncbi:MAG: hypothetical protein HYT20_02140 [Candidatus Nealsonbacteria bacterium]|nr:hypothetical protein [Candidatus Nealsonbacteria bacterium]